MLVMHRDMNAQRSMFKDVQDKLLVRDIFYTLQGEGPLTGLPAVFLRLGGCNFGDKLTTCTFCDTDFTISKSTWMDFASVYNRLIEVGLTNHGPCGLLVVTGGEPFLQQGLPGFLSYLESCNATCKVQIETNGSLYLPLDHHDLVVVCSPKAATGKEYPKLPTDVIAMVDDWKFLIEDNPQSPYHSPPVWSQSLQQPIWLSPIVRYRHPPEAGGKLLTEEVVLDSEVTQANIDRAVFLCKTFGYRLSFQTHVFAGVK